MSMDFFPEDDFEDPAWTYRGHRLKSSEFVSSLAHQYRAAVQHTNSFRTRLDVTTNWAVVVTGVSISIAFSQPNVHHGVLILNALLITSFLMVEARRYRYYEMWNQRVRGLETDFFAALLGSSTPLSSKWAQELALQLRTPKLPISLLDAIGIRLRRNYLWIFLILGTAWLAKYWLFPAPPSSWYEFVGRAAIGSVPGTVVVGFSLGYFLILILVALLTMNLAGSKSSQEGTAIRVERQSRNTKVRQSWFGWKRKKRQVLAFIITDKAEEVSSRILSELKRGVTSIVSADVTLLICALRSDEIRSLKSAVIGSDANATINVTSADEIWGKGFDPLFDE
jgi:uncharacterized membrane protein